MTPKPIPLSSEPCTTAHPVILTPVPSNHFWQLTLWSGWGYGTGGMGTPEWRILSPPCAQPDPLPLVSPTVLTLSALWPISHCLLSLPFHLPVVSLPRLPPVPVHGHSCDLCSHPVSPFRSVSTSVPLSHILLFTLYLLVLFICHPPHLYF